MAAHWTVYSSAQADGVDRPHKALACIDAELDLDHDAEHGLAVVEQHDQIRAVLGLHWLKLVRTSFSVHEPSYACGLRGARARL